MESKFVCGLRRLGDNIKKYKLISLAEKNEVTIGRSPDVTVCLLSSMISRCHSVLKKNEEGKWTIKDNKSLNGLYINGKKLQPQKPHVLCEGDIVQLGVPTEPEQPAEFVYQFSENVKVKQARPLSSSSEDGCEKKPGKYPMKRIKLETKQSTIHSVDKRLKFSDAESKLDETDNKFKVPIPGKSWSPFQDYKQKLKEQEDEAKAKLAEYEAKLAEMQQILKTKDEKNKEMEDALRQKEEQMKEELRKKEEEEEKMREELENQLLDREARMMEQLQSQKDSLVAEKQKVEESLKQAMDRALEEKDRHLEEELTRQKERLENVITQKETEQRMLESQLNETKIEKDQEKEGAFKARQDILSNFAGLMETELQCSICNELFIQATSLNCSHAFCSYCIEEWMKVKKECPNCRTKITSKVKSIVLDSYIDKMVEHLDDDMKDIRKDLIASRKAEVEAKEAAAGPSGKGRGRGRGRGGGGRSPGPAIVIESGSSDRESDEESEDPYYDSDEDDSDAISGDEGAYYGGYGRCYSCGSTGHWANGCPYQ